ncbi:polysaccharide biosynthesis tyrosine autokinase [Sporosarcina sp. E16_8]|uniref:polysaccharide biosynthesis tyrosine autokinase n=1 Tax=Sporosarcina sp. E16_8 TaxID=2789295 RepID=UPI001A93551D|nr:polysaccharide biosynthesis tyrosine autokinase [Sporosarcina sp. E16_8]MBO0588599.1 polysaccharide biosynthesis tyrosine autokinase [Sporosarcina sp. E16_8]
MDGRGLIENNVYYNGQPNTNTLNQEMEMKDLVEAIGKRLKIVVILVFLFTLCGGLIGYFIPPTYEAKIDVLINATTGSTGNTTLSMSEIDMSFRLVETYKEIMRSDRMRSKVNSKLEGLNMKFELEKNIRIESGNNSQIITIIAHEKTPKRATDLVNIYGSTFQEEIKTLMNLNNVTILKEAVEETDTRKIKSNLFFYLTLSFITSSVVCLAVIIIKEVYFSFLDSERKVERVLQVPLLGTINSNSEKFHDVNNPYELTRTLRSDLQFSRAFDEDFGRLAANIHYLIEQKKVKVIMMASSNPGDGKTFIGVNLTVALAKDNKKTLFVDTNFRKSDGRLLFDLPERKGLTSVLSGNYKLNEIVQETGIKNLSFIGTGPLPSNPTPFLLSEKMDKLLDELKTLFDVIIIDSPALIVADAVSLLRMTDGCIFIVNARKTSEKQAIDSFQSLSKVNGSIIGTVLNDDIKR